MMTEKNAVGRMQVLGKCSTTMKGGFRLKGAQTKLYSLAFWRRHQEANWKAAGAKACKAGPPRRRCQDMLFALKPGAN